MRITIDIVSKKGDIPQTELNYIIPEDAVIVTDIDNIDDKQYQIERAFRIFLESVSEIISPANWIYFCPVKTSGSLSRESSRDAEFRDYIYRQGYLSRYNTAENSPQ